TPDNRRFRPRGARYEKQHACHCTCLAAGRRRRRRRVPGHPGRHAARRPRTGFGPRRFQRRQPPRFRRRPGHSRRRPPCSSPREVCNDVVVQERMPERDGNVGGTVAGAVIGGLVGNQVGGGNGRKLATVAGAVGGGFAGREVDRRHVGGQVVERIDRQCRTVQDSSQSSRVVAYTVTYRNPDGTTGTMRTDSKPGNRIALGDTDVTVGYDVTYSYDGKERNIRMDERPGDRLPVIDGQVVTQVAALDGGN